MSNEYVSGLLALARVNMGCTSNYCLANELGASQATVIGWQKGRATPSGDAAVKLAKAVGIDPGSLLLWSSIRQLETKWPDASAYAYETMHKKLRKSDLVPRGSDLDPWG